MPKKSNSQVATKDDLKKLATKSELKRVEKSLRQEILKVDEKVERVEESQERVEAKLDKISTQLDGFVGRVDDLTVENKVGANQIRELDVKVDGHEKRIKQLESPPA